MEISNKLRLLVSFALVLAAAGCKVSEPLPAPETDPSAPEPPGSVDNPDPDDNDDDPESYAERYCADLLARVRSSDLPGWANSEPFYSLNESLQEQRLSGSTVGFEQGGITDDIPVTQNLDSNYVYSGTASARVSHVFRAGFKGRLGQDLSSLSFWIYPVGEQTLTYSVKWASLSFSCGGSGYDVGASHGYAHTEDSFTAEPFVWTRVDFPVGPFDEFDAHIEISAPNEQGDGSSPIEAHVFYLDEFMFNQ